MKCVLDAQLPMRLAVWLNELGWDVVHSSELPSGNRSSDDEMSRFADQEGRILISKDRDFLDAYLVRGTPKRLLWVTVGNTTNDELRDLFSSNRSLIERAFSTSNCVELRKREIVVHR